jgi:hypothetical protein
MCRPIITINDAGVCFHSGNELVWVPDEDVFEDLSWIKEADKSTLAGFLGTTVEELNELSTGNAFDRAGLVMDIISYWGVQNVI